VMTDSMLWQLEITCMCIFDGLVGEKQVSQLPFLRNESTL
jgi:hypothetical protein